LLKNPLFDGIRIEKLEKLPPFEIVLPFDEAYSYDEN